MALLQISEEQKKLLEGSDAGKAVLASLNAAEKELSQKLSEGEAKLAAAEKARKDLEDALLDPTTLEALSARKQGRPSAAAVVVKPEPEAEEDWDNVPVSRTVARLRAEHQAALAQERDSLRKEVGSTLKTLTTSIQAAFHELQLEQLEDRHGEAFTKDKEEFEKFAKLPENQQLRPRELFKKLSDKRELEAKRKAEADAAAVEAARQKEQEAFAENPDGAVAPGATGEKKVPEDAFERAWRVTPGTDKLLRST